MSDFAKKILYIIENKQFEKTKNLFSFEEKIKLLNMFKNEQLEAFKNLSYLELIKFFKDTFTTQEAFQLYNECNNLNDKYYVLFMAPDFIKLKPINTNMFDEGKTSRLISTFNDDNQKVKFLDKLTKDTNKKLVLISLDDDNLKVKYMTKIKDSYELYSVLQSMETNKSNINGMKR